MSVLPAIVLFTSRDFAFVTHTLLYKLGYTSTGGYHMNVGQLLALIHRGHDQAIYYLHAYAGTDLSEFSMANLEKNCQVLYIEIFIFGMNFSSKSSL